MEILLNPIKQLPGLSTKVEVIVKHCFYMIATGKWPPGMKLPNVRSAEKEWSFNRITILKSYKILVEKGLVEHRPNSGYYVLSSKKLENITHRRLVIENIYRDLYKKIENETDMLPFGVIRAIAEVAEMDNTKQPECAFIECTKSQAEGHANEISERFNIPILALTFQEIKGKKWIVPPHVKILISTFFHRKELHEISDSCKLRAIEIPIEISPSLIEEIKIQNSELIFLESKKERIYPTAHDAFWMFSAENARVEHTKDMDCSLKKIFGKKAKIDTQPRVLIAQHDWDKISLEWKKHPKIYQITCVMSDSAWPIITNAINLPFGESI